MRSTIAVFSMLFLFLIFITGCEREEIEELIPDDPVLPEITITIESEDRILVDGEPIAIEELAEHLEELVREDEARAHIHAAPGVSPELINEVEEIASGVEGLEIQTDIPGMERM